MGIEFGREVCGDLSIAENREWLVTNGIGGYASGTIAGLLTRRYHGLLIAALNPPLGRTLLLAQFDETIILNDREYALSTSRWADPTGNAQPTVTSHGYRYIEQFCLEGSVPTWHFSLDDVRLEKRIWMQQGANTTYVQYQLQRATQPVQLRIKALINHRDHHSDTQNNDWLTTIVPIEHLEHREHLEHAGIAITAYPNAQPLYLFSSGVPVLIEPVIESVIEPNWYYNFDLARERYRGLCDHENHRHVATLVVTLPPGGSFTIIASTESMVNLDGAAALQQHHAHEKHLIDRAKNQYRQNQHPQRNKPIPDWIQQLILAADQFIVDRPLADQAMGKTIIAGYPWFGDWGRDTMISLPGLTLATGRPAIARSILQTFAQYIDRGMLPNRFPDAGAIPEYNTADATLWYFEAIRIYHAATDDHVLLGELFPALATIIDWHCRGTRYGIQWDRRDGLLNVGEPDVQLTWMDAKVDDWVVTPRMGKPIEINALWYNALRSMAKFARCLNQPHQEYDALADRALAGFSRFWQADRRYCYDVLDGPNGDDATLRPNQIFAIALPAGGTDGWAELLSQPQQRCVIERCSQRLLTSYGLRSLTPDHPQYQGHYGGNQLQRDGAYHQGTSWGWLLGPFVQAHWRVYQNPIVARQLLQPMANHLWAHGLGSLSEIFDGDAPFAPRGCIAQAWTVATVLQAWTAINGD
jgi:predicted glycogen debranching enzyme